MEENKDILKKGLLKPSKDFTSNLLVKINGEEKALSNVLLSNGSMETSEGFTTLFMSKIGNRVPAKPYVPVISRRIWVGIAAAFIGMMVLAGFYAEDGTYQLGLQESMQEVSDSIASSVQSGPIFYYLMFGALILSLGLFTEQRIGKKIK